MAIQLSTTVRNARLESIETTIGASPTLEVRSGAPPADCSEADSGTVLATIALPADWMADAAAGSKAMAGTWQDLSADNTGDPGHYRIKVGATTHLQGTAGGPSANPVPDMVFDTDTFTAGQSVTITSYVWNEGNA
jgi:hypothetical protein